MPIYSVNGKKYNIPNDKIEGFEKRYPDASVEYHNDGKAYNIPLSKREGFLKTFPNATYETQPMGESEQVFSPEEEKKLQTANREQIKNLSPYVDSLLNKRSEVLDAERKKKEEELPFFARLMKNAPRGGGAAGLPEYAKTNNGRLTDNEYMSLQTASRSLKNAQRIIDEADHNAATGGFDAWLERSFAGGAARGLGQKLFDPATWDMGVTDMQEESAIANALATFESGGTLTEGQQALLDAKAVELATNAYFGSYVGKGYKAGQVTAEAIPFMLEMAINPASGVGKGATKALTRYALKRFGKEAAENTLRKATDKVVEGAIKGVARAGGDLAGAATMAATTGLPRTLADTQRRMTGDLQFSTDEEGNASFAGAENGEEPGKAFAKALGATTIENYSEMVGDYFAPILKPIGKGARYTLDKMNLGAVNRFIDGVKMSDVGKLVADFESQAQWNGTIGEYAEEVVGGVMNALTVGDQTLDTDEDTGVFNLDRNIETFTSVALMGGLMSAAKTVGYRTPKYRARKEVKRAESRAKELVTDWEDVKESLHGDNLNDALKGVLVDENYTPTQRRAILEYVAAEQNYDGVVRGETKMQTEGDADQRLIDLQKSFDNGYSLNSAQEMNDAKNMLDYQRQKLEEIVGEDIRLFDSDAYNTLKAMEFGHSWGEDAMQAAQNFVNAKATYDGMIQHVQDDIAERVAESDAKIEAHTNKTSGYIVPATMKQEDRRVYVVDGYIAQYEDESGIDVEASDGSIVVRDAETGEMEMVSPDAVLNIDGFIDPEVERVTAAEAIRQQLAEEAAGKIDGVASFNTGDTYTVTGDDAQTNVTIAANEQGVVDNGDGTVNVTTDGVTIFPMKKEVIQQQVDAANIARVAQFEQQRAIDNAESGQATQEAERPQYALNDLVSLRDENGNAVRGNITTDADADGRYEVYTETPINGKRVNLFTRDELDNMLVEHNGEPAVQPATAIIAGEEQPFAEEKEPAASVNDEQAASDTAPSAMQRIPKDEQGNPIYEQADNDTAWDAIVEQTEGDVEMAQTVADGMVADKEAALKKLEKEKAKGGVTIAEKIAAEKERKAKIEAAKQELAKWKEIAGVAASRKAAPGINEESKTETVAEEVKPTENIAPVEEVQPTNEMQPIVAPKEVTEFETADEFIAGLLGGIKITPESFRNETGLKTAEQRSLVGIIAGEDKGGVSVERASEIIAESYGEELAARGFHGDQQEIRDMLIDILSSGNPRSYVKQSKERRAAQWVEQATAEADAWAQSYGFASYDDMLAYEEQSLPGIKERFKDFDEQTYWAILAENYEEYDTRRESERVGNGSEVLQGERPVSAPGVESAGERNEGGAVQDDVQSGAETADAQEQEVDSIVEPVGNGYFGEIYNQFKNGFKAAFDFLVGKRSGEAVGVFNRSEIGEIDLVWGDDKGGLSHILSKHVGEGKSFANIEDAKNGIADIIENGKIVFQNGDKVVIKLNGKIVTLRKNIRENGKKIADKNWILTAYDETKADGTSAISDTNKGQAAQPTAVSEGEVTTKPGNSNENTQESGEKVNTGVNESGNDNAPYTIAPAQYTTKKGKVLDMHLVKFAGELTKEQQRAAKELAKTDKGWYDREQGGFMMRSEESAKQLADTILNNDDAVSDAQPVSMTDIRKIVETEQQVQPTNTSGNRLVTDERYAELRERMRKKLGGQMNIGIDPEILAIGTEMAVYHLEKGARKFTEYAKAMIADLGDAIRPYLKAFYNGARNLPEVESSEIAADMTPYDEVQQFNVATFDKEHSDPFTTAEIVVAEQAHQEEAEQAKQEIINQRNTERRNEDEQTSANTEAIASQAETVADKAESDIETATTEEQLNDVVATIDKQIEEVNKQLALLGYYEADIDDSQFHESYGYMRSAEKKAVKDADALAKRIVKDLGIDPASIVDKKGKKRKVIAQANIAPAGGNVYIHLPLTEDRELYISVDLEPDYKGGNRDNLFIDHIMLRIENPTGQGYRYVGRNVWVQPDATYTDMLDEIRAEIIQHVPEFDLPARQSVSETEQKQAKAKKSKKKAVNSQQSDELSLFDDLFDNAINKEDGLQRNDDVRAGGLQADNSGHRKGLQTSTETSSESEQQDSRGTDLGGERTGDAVDRTVRPRLSDAVTEKKNTRNNHSERGKDHAPTSVDARIEANIKAIELAKQLLESGELATEKQMQTLRKFSGWGGLGKAFSEGTYYAPNLIAKRLRELLGEAAYQEAVMSANSAYYTPAYVVDTLWDIAEQMGFKGGNILEGSAGIGNILGQMPTHISERSNIHAIEIDGTSGAILSLLYPDAKVEIQGFEETRIANGSVDLAITNVPFVTGLRVNDTTGDKDLSKKFHNIHDFCIAKNVRKLREGGLGIFITSNGTLDNSKKLRDWIVNEGGADFVGAFRMHNKTFGGTGVTSDIIVIRKRVNGKKSANAIDVSTVTGERMAEYDTGETRKVKGQIVPVVKQLSMDYNKYFVEHPENMAGEMHFAFEEGDTFRPTSKGLYPKQDKKQEQMLAEFVQSFKAEEFGEKTTDEIEVIDAMPGKKIGEVFVSDGKLYINAIGAAQPLEVNANKVKGHTKVECFEAYSAIKEALAAVLEYQITHEDDKGLKPLLAKLNKAYDDFVATYGHFNKNTAIAFLRNDVDYANVFALEKFEESADAKGNKVQKFGKTDVFSKRVIEKEAEPMPTNVKDGIVASIFKFGRVDIPYIAEQLGKSEAEVKTEIIESGYGFEDPATRQVEVSYQYLSGNVREKLRQAQENNENGEFDRNIKALQEVMPMTIPAHLIDFTLGSSWIEPKLYEEYVKERTDVSVQFTAVGGTWFMNEPYYTAYEKNRAMGVTSEMLGRTVMGHTLIEAAIQNRSITVSTVKKNWDGSTETITDKEATQACSAKIDEIRQDFKEWARQKMQSDAEMSERMERVYNDTFNNYVPMSIPDDFVPEYFGGASHEFKMRPHQGRAIVRGTMQPLLLAHEVGTGKTFTLISTAMEMRRLGTARKPMIVVQNATVGQFVASAKELYPNAKILTLEEADRSADGRKNFYAKIKYNDWDMIVVPQSTFEFIPDSEERQMAFVQEKIEEKMLVLEQMKEADPDGKSMITRQAEREIALLEEELAGLSGETGKKRTANDEKKRAVALQNAEVKAMEMLDRRTDDVENFDDMGIDALLIDEAHEYKHLGFATAMQRGVKGVDPSYSKKSQGVFLKTQAVLEKNNGRNVIFATGTPISNTAAEIWTFMRYLMPADTMKEYGIYYFDDFVRNFGNIQQMLEFTTSGKFKENNRFAGYVNLPELVRIWSSVSDTVLTKEAGGVSDKIPDMEGGKAQDLYLPQTRALRSIMKFVKAELERYDKMSGKEKKENSHIPLTMYGIAKAAAVDARLVQSDAEDDAQSKTNEAVRQTLRSLKESADYKGTVAIFADNYQNKESGFNLYEDIRTKLIAEGVPADEIVVIKSGMTVKKKLEIFEKVNRGEVRVILGSTFTLGTGVNIQERLYTLIHLDAPNRPMDYTQRNGRILRQGNLHKAMGKPVRVLRFGVEDSLDVTAYQRLKTKGAIADSIMNGKQMMANSMTNRVLEEEEDVFGDTVAQLSGSEYAMLKNNAEKNVRKYASRKKQWEADQTYIHNAKPRIRGNIKFAEQLIEENGRYLEAVRTAFPDGKAKEIVISKHRFADIEAMADFFKEYNKGLLADMNKIRDGELSGEQKRELTIQIGDFAFKVNTLLTKEIKQSGMTLFTEVRRNMTYSCPELGIENSPVHQQLLRNAVEDIIHNVITGRDFTERLEAAKRSKKHNEAELEQLLSREGKPFEYETELEQAKAQYEEYAELMKKELEEKEAKYAEIDATVETADNLSNSEEDDTLYRSDDAYTADEISYENDSVSKALGGLRFTPKQRREFAERERQRIVARVESLAKKLHLDNVEVVTDSNRLEGKKRTAKGFYSKSTGKITVVIPNHSSVADVEKTLLHEAVAHYGLRKLFGENFDTFLDNVYNSADVSIRREIANLAAKNGWDFRKATEEYLAMLAENTEFEAAHRTGWWGKIKRMFLDMLHKIGFEGFDQVLTDNELRYILWRSYENLKEPGRYRSILGEVADVAKQYELKVGNYAEGNEIPSTAADIKENSVSLANNLNTKENVNIRNEVQNPGRAQKVLLGVRRAYDRAGRPSYEANERVARSIREANAEKTIIAYNPLLRETLDLLRRQTDNEIYNDMLPAMEMLRDSAKNEQEREDAESIINLIKRFRNRNERGTIIRNLTGANLGEEIPFSKIDELFELYNSDEDIAELYKRVKPFAEELGLVFKFDNLKDDDKGGAYTPALNTITFNAHMLYAPYVSQQRKASTIVHEIIHAVTVYAITAKKNNVKLSPKLEKAAQAINDIYDNVVKGNPALVHDVYDANTEEMVPVADYGTLSVLEMVAELANPEFANKLKQLEYDGRSVWQKIWDAIKSIFVGENEPQSVYEQLSEAFDTLVENFDREAFERSKEDGYKFYNIIQGVTNQNEEEDVLFRTGDPEIHERALARDRYEQRVKSGMYQSQEALQDSMLSLKVAMQAIVGNDTNIEDVDGFENAYLGENRLSSVNKAEADAFAHTLFKPMLDEVAKLAKTAEEREMLTDYMMAKHGLERNEYMRNEAIKNGDKKAAKRDFAGLTALTGIDSVADAEAEAQRMVEEYEKTYNTDELWKRVNAVSKAILQKSYECGLMSKENFDNISGMYKYYIPLRGFDEKTSMDAYAYLDRKQGAFNAPIKKAEGRSSKADDPFANLQSMAESAIMQGNRNKLVKQRFLNFALNHPSDLVSVSNLWLQFDDVSDEWKPVFPDNIDNNDASDVVEKKMQDFEKKMKVLAEQNPDKYKSGKDAVGIPYRVLPGLLKEHQVIVKRGGRDYVLTVNGNPRLAQALNGQTNPDNSATGAFDAILRTGEKINRQLSAFYTTRNPDFVVSNFLRDLLYANSMVWIKESPNYALRFHRNNLTKANPVMMKQMLAKYRKGTLDMNDKTEAMFYQFMINGGETGYVSIRDIEQHKSDIKKELQRANGKLTTKAALKLLGERLDEYNRAIENCARFAAFVTSREMGRTIDRAIYDAKEISVNFNKKGSGAKFYGAQGQTATGNASAFVSGIGRSGFVFWNAAIQGTTNFGRQVKRHPAKAFTGAAAMFLLGALVAYLGGDDEEDDKNAYYNLPEYVRRSNILFRAGDSWISIPLPIEYRALYGMGELMTSVLSKKEHFTGAEIAEAVAGQVSQILPIDFLEGGGGLNAFVPSAAKPLWEAYVAEKSWTGMPLYKDTPFNKDMPEWTKAYKSANKYIVGLAAALNEATGGDRYTKGGIDINPAKIEYMLNGYFGGVSGTIDKLTKTAETIAGEREYDPRSFLLLNRVVKAGDERTEYRAVNNEYFRVREEAKETKRRLNAYEKDTDLGIFDYAEKIDFLYNSPEYLRYEIYEDYRRDIDALYDELKGFEEIGDKETAKDIEAELNELKKEMIEEMNLTRK